MNEDLNRVFDQVKPSRSQKEAMLSRLLEPERKVKPMKKLKKLTVLGVAAALMVISCAAAVMTGLDQRLADYFGASPEQAELLAPGAVPVDITVEDNGAALHVTQVLMDRYNILFLCDFTAPEGTVLDMVENDSYQGLGRGDEREIWFNSAGEPVDVSQPGYGGWLTLLDDGDPLDNHLTMLEGFSFMEGIQPEWEISGVYLPHINLVRWDQDKREMIPVCSGDWSCEVPFTWQDMGQAIWPNQVIGQLDGKDIILTELYFSPMTTRICYEWDIPELTTKTYSPNIRWHQVLDENRMTLTTRDGRVIPLTQRSGMACGLTGYREQYHIYQLSEIAALEDLKGGNLNIRIEGGSVDIPLDGLTPVE